MWPTKRIWTEPLLIIDTTRVTTKTVQGPTHLKFGPTMRTEEEGVGPDLVAMLERVRLLVALILDDNKQPGHQRRHKQQRFAVSRIFDAAHNCEATAADVLKDL